MSIYSISRNSTQSPQKADSSAAPLANLKTACELQANRNKVHYWVVLGLRVSLLAVALLAIYATPRFAPYIALGTLTCSIPACIMGVASIGLVYSSKLLLSSFKFTRAKATFIPLNLFQGTLALLYSLNLFNYSSKQKDSFGLCEPLFAKAGQKAAVYFYPQ